MSPRRPLRSLVLIGMVLPAVVALAGAVVLLTVSPELPDPVAVHWSGGAPDGFAPIWMPPVIVLATGLGLPTLMTALALPELRRGASGWAHRLLAATALGLSGFVTVLIVASTVPQAGLADAADAGPIGPALLASLIAGAVLGVGGWLLQPAPTALEAAPPAITAPGIADDATPWEQRITIARTGFIVLGSCLALLVAACILTIVSTSPGWPWVIVIIATLLVGLVTGSCVTYRVRVDADGLSVASVFGWPRLQVPASDIETVRVVEVSPFAEFGGWGWRWAGGRTGIVTRAGAGIEVRRRGGSLVVVTLDDAEKAATILAGFAART